MSKWSLVWSESALKDLRKLDKHVAKVIITKTAASLDNIQDPKTVLIPLKYAKKGQYKYRIGNYRVICRMIENEFIVEAIIVGHRKEVYKKYINRHHLFSEI